MNTRLQGHAQGQRRHRRPPMALLLAMVFSGTSASTLAAPPSSMHTVEIEALKFSPPTLEVKAGDTVIWKNKDAFPHNVTAQNKSFRSTDLLSGQSWKFKANKPGMFPYVCTLHPGMKAVLTVK
jgi:plastocyanin